jgi:DNA-directed RNA polymerase subunit RPC12/RpoP
MTLEFNCPNCGALIAFDSKYAGKRAKCLTCGQKFLIPAESFQKPERIEPEPEKKEPIPGFYHAVFVDSWKVFVNPQNATTLVFVTAVVCFKFFLARGCCINYIAPVIIWGWLLGFYVNLLNWVALEDDLLPEIDLGTSLTFLWYILQPFLVFLYTLFLVQLPFLIALSLLQERGITFQNLWTDFDPAHLLVQALFLGGLFLFPAAILATAVGKDLTFLRPGYLLAPLRRAFFPYLLVVALLALAFLAEMHATQYTGAGVLVTAQHLAGNLLVQVLAILAMRSIGLLYRHYGCYFKW